MSLFQSKDLETVKRLIAAGADVNEVDYRERSVVCYAAYEGHVDSVIALINAKADVNKADREGFTPLHEAVCSGHAKCVRVLVQHGADVYAQTNFRNSALHFASLNNNLQCMQILAATGALLNIDKRDSHGETPLSEAIKWNHCNVAEFLLHLGARIPSKKIPDWMRQLIIKRQNAMRSTLTLKGILKRRLGQSKDVTNLLGLYVWNKRVSNE
jgi:ankyrin repeat protein